MGEQSSFAEQIADGDPELAEVMADAARAMDRLGITAQDFLSAASAVLSPDRAKWGQRGWSSMDFGRRRP